MKRAKKKVKKKVEEEKKEEKPEESRSRNPRLYEKQIKWFVIVMIALLIIIFIVYAFIQGTLKFRYAGLEFEKVREGDLILYRTPVFPIFLREDPRNLRDIEVEGRILLQRKLGIGADKELASKCKDSTIAATSLSIFFGRTGLEPFSATRNKTEAEEFGLTYVECGLNLGYSVVMLEGGIENKIRKEGDCYILEVANCEIMDVAERFMVASYAHSRGIEV